MKHVGRLFLFAGLVMFVLTFYMLTLNTPPFGLTAELFGKVKTAQAVSGLIFSFGAGFAFLLDQAMSRPPSK